MWRKEKKREACFIFSRTTEHQTTLPRKKEKRERRFLSRARKKKAHLSPAGYWKRKKGKDPHKEGAAEKRTTLNRRTAGVRRAREDGSPLFTRARLG